MESIKIDYQPFVSNEIIEALNSGYNKYADVSILPSELPRQHIEHWEANLSDLSLYFQNHGANILDGVLGTIGVEIIKAAYCRLTRSKKDNALLSIKLDYRDVKAEFNLEGDLTEQQIDKCFDNFKDIITEGTLAFDYSNPDYHQGTKGQMHRETPLPHQFGFLQYYFDTKCGIFKAHDFAEQHRKLQKEMRNFNH